MPVEAKSRGGGSGRVPSEGSSDVQLGACTGECAQIVGIRFGGNRLLQCNDAKVLFRVCCCFAS